MSSDSLLGAVVDGRYAINKRLAQGGMATVYRARDKRLERDVALKLLQPHLADNAEFTERFNREARAAARLSSAFVVTVHDQGVWDAGNGRQAYLVMEYVPGPDLRSELTRLGSFNLGTALTIAEQTLRALSTAHSAGIVHRDVKPENIMLASALPPSGTFEPADIHAKVADFGIARAATSAAGTSGQVMGTVAYLAPEVASTGVAQAPADVYAVGIMLYESLTGQLPFQAETAISTAYMHINEPMPRASEKAEWLPESVDDFIAQLTAKDPSLRPQNGEMALRELLKVARAIPEEDLLRRVPVASPAGQEGTGGQGGSAGHDGAGGPESAPDGDGSAGPGGSPTESLPESGRPAEGSNATMLMPRGQEPTQSYIPMAPATPPIIHPRLPDAPAGHFPAEANAAAPGYAAGPAQAAFPSEATSPAPVASPAQAGSPAQVAGPAAGPEPARPGPAGPGYADDPTHTAKLAQVAGPAESAYSDQAAGPGQAATAHAQASPPHVAGAADAQTSAPDQLAGPAATQSGAATDPQAASPATDPQATSAAADPQATSPGEPSSGDSSPQAGATPGQAATALKTKRPRRRIIVVALTLAVLAASLVCLWYFRAGPGMRTEVPDVAGQTYKQAVSKLNASGLKAQRQEAYSDTVPAGAVISTSPEAGQRIHPSRAVSVTVSLGVEQVAVPDVVGQTETEADRALASARLTPKKNRVYSEDVAKGTVISQSLEPGSKVDHHTEVAITISKGREPTTVPDVTGKKESAAKSAIEKAGLKVERKQAYSDDVDKGVVISQTPEQGSAYKNDTVTITVSRGPEEVEVPRVVGMSREEARSTLEEAGFTVKEEEVLGGYLDTVRSQSPGGGKEAKKGSTVTISII